MERVTLVVFWTRVDKNSGFSGQYPKKPETRSSGSGRVGFDFWVRVFSGQKTRKNSKVRVNPGIKFSGFFTTLVYTRANNKNNTNYSWGLNTRKVSIKRTGMMIF